MILHPHNPGWAEAFSCLKEVYERELGDAICAVEHVGSTAITGISAKPILDIDLVIPNVSCFHVVREGLEELGYRHNGNQGIPGREAFKRQSEQTPFGKEGRFHMPHHLYVCAEGSRELVRHLRFRDYLNAHPEARTEYQTIKVDIEARSDNNRKTYATIKESEGICGAFVSRVLHQACRLENTSAPHTCFISGHLSLTAAEFEQYYRPGIDAALVRGDAFVVGDAKGADALSQQYLFDKTDAVRVFHMLESPRHNPGFQTVGGFASDEERDQKLTVESDYDIAWVRPGREGSGTDRNLARRLKQV